MQVYQEALNELLDKGLQITLQKRWSASGKPVTIKVKRPKKQRVAKSIKPVFTVLSDTEGRTPAEHQEIVNRKIREMGIEASPGYVAPNANHSRRGRTAEKMGVSPYDLLKDILMRAKEMSGEEISDE